MKRRGFMSGIATLIAAPLALASDRKPIVYVDPATGNDANTGTAAFPFRTMHRAGQWVASQQQGRCTVRVEGW